MQNMEKISALRAIFNKCKKLEDFLRIVLDCINGGNFFANFFLEGGVIKTLDRKTSNWRYVLDPSTYPTMIKSSVFLYFWKNIQHNVKGLLFKSTHPSITSIWRIVLSLGYGRLPLPLGAKRMTNYHANLDLYSAIDLERT